MEKQYDSAASSFWTDRGDACTVLGDVLGRLPAIELLSPQPGERVLDVGCGAGWCTRRIALTGARVIGFDVAATMLAAAKKTEQEKSRGITYRRGDLTRMWPADRDSVDAVFCNAVLIHVNPEGVQRFFHEARRVLHPGGRLVVSVSHRELLRLQEKEGLRPGWVCYEPGTWDADDNAVAVEHYFDGRGREFVSRVWLHNLFPAAQKAGFEVVEHHDRIVTRESLVSVYGERSTEWPAGFPAFEQILAR